jgi:hypothetical protein
MGKSLQRFQEHAKRQAKAWMVYGASTVRAVSEGGAMMSNYYVRMGLERWANTDPSLHYNRIDPQPSRRWVGVWIYLLKVRDYEAAAMVRRVNGGGAEKELSA